MTKSVNTPPTPEPDKPKGIRRLLRKLKPTPKKVTGGLLAIATLAMLIIAIVISPLFIKPLIKHYQNFPGSNK